MARTTTSRWPFTSGDLVNVTILLGSMAAAWFWFEGHFLDSADRAEILALLNAHNTVIHRDYDEELEDLGDQMIELTEDLKKHIDRTTIQRLESRLEDVDDQLWLLEERMREDGGNTQSNRKRKRDLEKRREKLETQIQCVREERNHCLDNIASLEVENGEKVSRNA